MSTPAKRRLMRDFRRLQTDPPQGVNGTPHEDDIMDWSAVILGPDDSPWEGGTFRLSLAFTEDYPNRPPVVKFVSRLFHPNVYANGAICLDILQNQWSPIYDVAAILTSIQSLLTDPNPGSPANVEAARLYTENRREYDRRVMEIVEQSWRDVELEEAGEEEEEEMEMEVEAAEGAESEEEAREAAEQQLPEGLGAGLEAGGEPEGAAEGAAAAPASEAGEVGRDGPQAAAAAGPGHGQGQEDQQGQQAAAAAGAAPEVEVKVVTAAAAHSSLSPGRA